MSDEVRAGTYTYYDGFNFYYRLFKNRRRTHKLPANLKWLDLLKLSQSLAPGQTVDWVGYFTAFVRQNPLDPDQHVRQRAYIEALRTIPCLEIVEGKFQPTTKRGIPVGCAICGASAVSPIEFNTFEEKGSDVNLAARLVRDAALGKFSAALVISNDSDLAEAIRIATDDFGRVVHVLSPDINVNNSLTKVASSAKPLDVKLLKRCQFPPTLRNAAGIVISRPVAWSR
ncbi:MAG: NYN domain-containing protein [Thermomicrobiales bacterium]